MRWICAIIISAVCSVCSACDWLTVVEAPFIRGKEEVEAAYASFLQQLEASTPANTSKVKRLTALLYTLPDPIPGGKSWATLQLLVESDRWDQKGDSHQLRVAFADLRFAVYLRLAIAGDSDKSSILGALYALDDCHSYLESTPPVLWKARLVSRVIRLGNEGRLGDKPDLEISETLGRPAFFFKPRIPMTGVATSEIYAGWARDPNSRLREFAMRTLIQDFEDGIEETDGWNFQLFPAITSAFGSYIDPVRTPDANPRLAKRAQRLLSIAGMRTHLDTQAEP